MYFLYFIKSERDSSFYVGITSDIEKRLLEHNLGKTRSTKGKLPYILVYYEAYQNKKLARKRELEIKNSWSKKEEVLKRIS